MQQQSIDLEGTFEENGNGKVRRVAQASPADCKAAENDLANGLSNFIHSVFADVDPKIANATALTMGKIVEAQSKLCAAQLGNKLDATVQKVEALESR